MTLIPPHKLESPSSYSERLGLVHAASVTTAHKKGLGQFYTPLEIARFMANLASPQKETVRILDPGCGSCVLSCSLIEALVEKDCKLKKIELTIYEIDKTLVPVASEALVYLKKWLLDKNIAFDYTLNVTDFLLDNSLTLFAKKSTNNNYDIVISNPPYFKLSMNDERVANVKNIVYGQPNIYTLFLYIAATLLNEKGELIFITPRSFASGNYYKYFRNEFFSLIQLKRIHLFESRKEAFNKDNVLQENVILYGIRGKIKANSIVEISSSRGLNDLMKSRSHQYKLNKLVDYKNHQKILHLPISSDDEKTINLFKSWTGNFRKYNIQISTGPVVSFRCNELLSSDANKDNLVPLILLHNTQKMKYNWPIPNIKKPQYIVDSDKSKKLLLQNKNYILLRRFSSKDDKSRLVATPYFSRYTEAPLIGVENHLNYIYRENSELDKHEILGLALLLNSSLCDAYFRTFNGSINVSATELREMPMPPLSIIKKIGAAYKPVKKITQQYIDMLVNEHITRNANE